MRERLAAERADAPVAFNPFDAEFRRTPESVYARLRQHSPIHYSRLLDCWIVTRHADVCAVLLDDRLFSSDPGATTQETVDPYALLDPQRPSLFMLDPPAHTRVRAAVRHAFTPGAVDRCGPDLTRIIGDVVASLGGRGDEVDLVPGFATAVPLRVMAAISGLDLSDPRVPDWIGAVVTALEPINTQRTASTARSAYLALGSHLDDHLRRPARRGTLLDTLGQAITAGTLTAEQARQLLFFLLLAGTKTVADFLAGAVVAWAAQPGARQPVSAVAVDRLLARLAPVQIVARCATAATVLAGHRIERGKRLLLVLASANQDPAADRDVTFGRGIHRCLGMHLARAQAHLALSALFRAYPAIRLTEAVPSRRSITLRGWDRVIVHL
jgi:cytochrome P450